MSEAFEKWWADEGSTPPAKGDDVETHTMKKCRIAWDNGAYVNEAERDALQAELEQLKNPWISVEDGLPIKTKMVLVKCNDIVSEWEQLIEAYVCPEYGNIFWQVEGEDFTPIVTHWMPLKKLEGEGDE